MSTSPRNGVSRFKKMLVKISQGLSRSDVQQLAYLHGVPEDKAGTALEVFSALEKEGKISENNYDLLLESLEDISRKDLLRICMAQKQGTYTANQLCVQHACASVSVRVRSPSV